MKTEKKAILVLVLLVVLVLVVCVLKSSCRRDSSVAYDDIIQECSVRHGVPFALVKAIIWKETKFDEKARGKAGEIGLMQIMPGAIEEWRRGTKNRKTPGERELFTPKLNIEIGTWYLAWCARHWKGYKSALLLQISEYNAGYGNVMKHWKPKTPQTEVSPEDITIKSTRQYVVDVIERMKMY